MLPVVGGARASPDADTLVALPLVGAVVGVLAGSVGWLASLGLPHVVAAALALAAAAVGTGAIHLDGFLDGCDAFFATASPKARLEILKDPRHGTFAVVGMFVAGALWLAALVALAPPTYPAILAFSGALARAAVVPSALVFPYAPGATQTRAFAARPPAAPLAAALLLLELAATRLGPAGPFFVPGALALALSVSWWVARRLGGGLVGDAYGFSIVVVEIMILVAMVAVRPAG